MTEYEELLKRLEACSIEFVDNIPACWGPPHNPDGPEAAAAIRDLQAKNAGYKGLLDGHAIVIKKLEQEKAELQAKLDAANQAGTFQQGIEAAADYCESKGIGPSTPFAIRNLKPEQKL